LLTIILRNDGPVQPDSLGDLAPIRGKRSVDNDEVPDHFIRGKALIDLSNLVPPGKMRAPVARTVMSSRRPLSDSFPSGSIVPVSPVAAAQRAGN
jgi:hypothetical protein